MKAILIRALALLGLTSILALTGCQDEDFGYTAEEISFNTNFQKEYGKIDPEQSWDFYRAKPRTAKFSPWMHGEAETRAGIPGYTQTDASAIIKNSGSDAYYDVLDETLDWMRANLVEEHNNTSIGESFSLLPPPHNDFAVIPIYIGQHTMDVSLHLVSDGKDYKVWSEWEGNTGVQVKDNATADWRTLTSNQNTLSVYDVQAKPIMINHEAVTKEFFFYLSIDKGHMKNENGYSGYEYSDGNYAITGTAQRSDEGMMLALGCPIPENISSTDERQNEVMIIGCEDSDQADSDWDINDLVFLIVGYPDIPNLVEYTRKRYMCEDLGNTFDFDFNDIVVDVDQEIVKEAKISQDGTMILFEEEAGSRKQYATIKHVCGTLPFQVKVGDFTFNKVHDPTDEDRTRQDLGASDTRGVNWNPDVCKKITGWKPEENNIWITVQDARTNPNDYVFTDLFATSVENENAAEHIYRVNFPKDGTPPMILALDQSVQWMDENVHIPESWWKEGKIFRKTLNLISNPAGAGTFIGAGSYLYGSKVHFSVRANGEYVFTGWSDGDTHITREMTLEENATLTANFKLAEKYQFLVTAGDNGSIEWIDPTFASSDNMYKEGTEIKIKANPDDGYFFDKWNDGDTNAERTIVLSENTELSASFRIAEYYSFLVSSEGNGAVEWITPTSPSSTNTYIEGTEIKIKAVPSHGYIFEKWSDDDVNPERTIVLDENTELTAYFKMNANIVTITCNPASGVRAIRCVGYSDDDLLKSTSNDGVYKFYIAKDAHPDLTIYADAADGYKFVKWGESDGGRSDLDGYPSVHSYLNSDLNLTATFEAKVVYDGAVIIDPATLSNATIPSSYFADATAVSVFVFTKNNPYVAFDAINMGANCSDKVEGNKFNIEGKVWINNVETERLSYIQSNGLRFSQGFDSIIEIQVVCTKPQQEEIE